MLQKYEKHGKIAEKDISNSEHLAAVCWTKYTTKEFCVIHE